MTNHPNRSRHADAQASPGPWHTTDNNISSIGIRAADGTAVCACRFQGPDGRTDHKSIGIAKANARLIVAAPELLAALKAVVRIADRQTVEFDAARAAIAKAAGPATPAAVIVGDSSECLSTICVMPDVCDDANVCIRHRLRSQGLTISAGGKGSGGIPVNVDTWLALGFLEMSYEAYTDALTRGPVHFDIEPGEFETGHWVVRSYNLPSRCAVVGCFRTKHEAQAAITKLDASEG